MTGGHVKRQNIVQNPLNSYVVHSLNREYRAELERQAKHERLVRVARAGEARAAWQRAALNWAGRRLMAAGAYLASRAEGAGHYEQGQVRVERAL